MSFTGLVSLFVGSRVVAWRFVGNFV